MPVAQQEKGTNMIVDKQLLYSVLNSARNAMQKRGRQSLSLGDFSQCAYRRFYVRNPGSRADDMTKYLVRNKYIKRQKIDSKVTHVYLTDKAHRYIDKISKMIATLKTKA